ncbi:succinate dehydrogenase flavoprotein subunit [Candidatus Aerophobetes bacterium]|uniref:succinate dehydrogenase n=1 Tax=Aerophobetes bacterium TaxID=2030807 RepID=A0A2A4X3F8_UNCAE|nr:MAG: succinate dehydrogenase flavoprotein subunit [Candidatus Aerophobetes bacterium]
MSDQKKKVIVVGGGLAGLACAVRLAEQGCYVDLISLTQVKRSHSVCAQGGINAAVDLQGEDDSTDIHAYDTIKGGDFLCHQPPVLEMCRCAPKIIAMMARFGCPFSRTPEGNIDFRRFGGTLYHRTAFCGASTGQQLLYSLDEQVRRYEVKRLVKKYEHHEFLRLVMDGDGEAKGIVMSDLRTLELSVLKSDAVVVATGGPGMIFKRSTNSTFCTGAAMGRLYKQGMYYANGEFIQIHPTSIPGRDKMRLMSESIRGEGGRIWVYGDSSKTITNGEGKKIACGKTGEPWYFLEDLYPAFGNLVPRDIAARECLRVMELGLGVEGRKEVFLDVRHLDEAAHHKIESVLKIYTKFTGEDPKKTPMRITPGVHYSMGGAWVDYPAVDDKDKAERYRHMSNLKGCFVIGEADYLYHGANRLGANSLLSCIFSGLVAGVDSVRYLEDIQEEKGEVDEAIFDEALKIEREARDKMLAHRGKENVHQLHDELSDIMIGSVTVKRDNVALGKAIEGIKDLKRRYRDIVLDDSDKRLNQTYVFAAQFGAMLDLAHVIAQSALLRDESRGSHYKSDFPDKDDGSFLKITMAEYDAVADGPKIFYEPIDLRYLDPIERDYTKAKRVKPNLRNVPAQLDLPL